VLRFPEDPLVALARARRELELGPPIPEVRLGRALQRLDEYRAATEYRSLEALLPESTRAWFAFYLEHDLDAAHQLVVAELEKEPAALDLWYMLGESYAALGQRSQAVETFRFLLRMLPDKRTTRSLARLLSQSGRDTDEVSQLVSQTMHLERTRGRDVDLQLSVARSLANNLSSESRDRALAMLQDLWNARGSGRVEAEVAEIGELYGLCLVWRFQGHDGSLAEQVLLEVDELLDDPARRHMLRAVSNLAP
jgi:tetratricopeptide (TPR) repeat protein